MTFTSPRRSTPPGPDGRLAGRRGPDHQSRTQLNILSTAPRAAVADMTGPSRSSPAGRSTSTVACMVSRRRVLGHPPKDSRWPSESSSPTPPTESMIQTRYPTRTPVTQRVSSRSNRTNSSAAANPADPHQRLGRCYRHDDSPPTANDETLPRENLRVRGRTVPCPSYVTVTGTHDHACPTEKSVSARAFRRLDDQFPWFGHWDR
jgi:hypothetical protein